MLLLVLLLLVLLLLVLLLLMLLLLLLLLVLLLLVLLSLLHSRHLSLLLVKSEDVDGLGVGAQGQIVTVLTEC